MTKDVIHFLKFVKNNKKICNIRVYVSSIAIISDNINARQKIDRIIFVGNFMFFNFCMKYFALKSIFSDIQAKIH